MVEDQISKEVNTLFDYLRDRLHTGVNGRLQKVTNVSLSEAVRKTVIEEITHMVKFKLSETGPTMICRS